MGLFAVIEPLQNITEVTANVEKVREFVDLKQSNNTGFYKNYVTYTHICPHTYVSQQGYELEYLHKKVIEKPATNLCLSSNLLI